MFQDSVNICIQAIGACLNWFDQFLDRLGFGSYLIGMVLVFLSYRFILQPIFGHGINGISDKASKYYDAHNYKPKPIIVKERKKQYAIFILFGLDSSSCDDLAQTWTKEKSGVMLEHIIPLLASYLNTGIVDYVFMPIFLCAVLATVPCIIRALVRSR